MNNLTHLQGLSSLPRHCKGSIRFALLCSHQSAQPVWQSYCWFSSLFNNFYKLTSATLLWSCLTALQHPHTLGFTRSKAVPSLSNSSSNPPGLGTPEQSRPRTAQPHHLLYFLAAMTTAIKHCSDHGLYECSAPSVTSDTVEKWVSMWESCYQIAHNSMGVSTAGRIWLSLPPDKTHLYLR